MAVDLEARPDLAAALCAQAHARLLQTVAEVGETVARRPRRLPGWSVGHVITHLARNADGHRRRVEGALAGRDVQKYEGGADQRASEIDAGARRPVAELLADLRESQALLERAFDRACAAGWPAVADQGAGSYPASASPAHRLREVEMHHVDLGLGYSPQQWPREYVEWDLPNLLRTVPGRIGSERDAAALTAWLAGRGDPPWVVVLEPWG